MIRSRNTGHACSYWTAQRAAIICSQTTGKCGAGLYLCSPRRVAILLAECLAVSVVSALIHLQ